ncbi:MAG TPA: glycosyltransferase family 39 protein [Vicinamibacterales bacterium]|nr:glycosyltransferase family 39 protein [Vicinamibacterales bacterium]
MENRLVDSRGWLRAATWAAVCWVILFGKLGAPALMDPDEAHYAQLTREMLRAHNWMMPLLDGLPYIDKPVLFHWLQGVAISVLGETELAMRLPSAFAGIALFWITRWTGVQLFDDRIGTRAWLMLATLPLTFMLGSIGVLDMVFTAFLFGAIAVALVAVLRHRPQLQWVSCILLSLAVMTKGPVALVLAGLFFVVALACGKECRAAVLSLRWATCAVLTVLLSLPWFVWMYYTLGWHFVHQYALAGNLYYVTQPQSFSNRAPNHTLYVSTFVAGFFPWSIVVLGGALDTIRRWRARITIPAEERLLWAWVGVIFIVFSIARFKVDRYVYPAAPACCLLAARAWMSISVYRLDLAIARDNACARWSVVMLGGILVVAGLVSGFTLFDLGLELPRAALLIPISLAASGVVLETTILRRRAVSPSLFGAVIVMLLVVYASVATIGLPLLERARPTEALADSLRPHLAADDRVALYRLEKWRFSLRYYLERPLGRLQDPNDVRKFLTDKGGYILMLDEDFARLRSDGINLRSVAERPAVTGTTGTGLRKQKWGALVAATSDDTPRR